LSVDRFDTELPHDVAKATQSRNENKAMNTAANTTRCPNCGQLMKLARVTPRVGGLPELQTFECRPCGVALTDAVDDLSARPNTRYRSG
jgi:transposase-like protein